MSFLDKKIASIVSVPDDATVMVAYDANEDLNGEKDLYWISASEMGATAHICVYDDEKNGLFGVTGTCIFGGNMDDYIDPLDEYTLIVPTRYCPNCNTKMIAMAHGTVPRRIYYQCMTCERYHNETYWKHREGNWIKNMMEETDAYPF